MYVRVSNMLLLKQALNKLATSELKMTERRVRMLEVLYFENRYLSAREVKDQLKEDYPGISPDTIYRNLHDFSTLEILEETEISGEKYFRANCGINKHHHHFICTECGYSEELAMCPLHFFQEQLGNSVVTSHRFELFGLCENCLSEAPLK